MCAIARRRRRVRRIRGGVVAQGWRIRVRAVRAAHSPIAESTGFGGFDAIRGSIHRRRRSVFIARRLSQGGDAQRVRVRGRVGGGGGERRSVGKRGVGETTERRKSRIPTPTPDASPRAPSPRPANLNSKLPPPPGVSSRPPRRRRRGSARRGSSVPPAAKETQRNPRRGPRCRSSLRGCRSAARPISARPASRPTSSTGTARLKSTAAAGYVGSGSKTNDAKSGTRMVASRKSVAVAERRGDQGGGFDETQGDVPESSAQSPNRRACKEDAGRRRRRRGRRRTARCLRPPVKLRKPRRRHGRVSLPRRGGRSRAFQG